MYEVEWADRMMAALWSKASWMGWSGTGMSWLIRLGEMVERKRCGRPANPSTAELIPVVKVNICHVGFPTSDDSLQVQPFGGGSEVGDRKLGKETKPTAIKTVRGIHSGPSESAKGLDHNGGVTLNHRGPKGKPL
jgi:hypothetical protein